MSDKWKLGFLYCNFYAIPEVFFHFLLENFELSVGMRCKGSTAEISSGLENQKEDWDYIQGSKAC